MVQVFRKADLEALKADMSSLAAISPDIFGKVVELEQLRLLRELWAS